MQRSVFRVKLGPESVNYKISCDPLLFKVSAVSGTWGGGVLNPKSGIDLKLIEKAVAVNLHTEGVVTFP